METLNSCNTSSLNVYVPTTENPWNAQKVNHIFRRLGYGANTIGVALALAQTPENFIDSLVDVAINTLPMPEPSWVNMTYQDYINAGLDFDDGGLFVFEEADAFVAAGEEEGDAGAAAFFGVDLDFAAVFADDAADDE